MGISYLRIENYKSIKSMNINLLQLNALIGSNGSGKSNVISAIKMFYDNMIKYEEFPNRDIFDKNNKYSNEIRITIGYNLKSLRQRYNINRNTKYKEFFEKIKSLNNNGVLELTMIAIKGKNIIWNRDILDRKLLYLLYPIYFIDSRRINLYDWENLWLQIGDLRKLEVSEEKEFKDGIKEKILQDNVSNKIYKKIDEIFFESDIKIKKYSPRELASISAKLYFGGSEFEFNDRNLIYFSDGTNIYNFIKMFIQMVSLLNEFKIKEPIMIIDEPETSLHHNYIDNIFEDICLNMNKITFLLSTHSSRMIKNILIKSYKQSTIYHVKLSEKYTIIKKMNLFDCNKENREKIVITDTLANSYFSKMIVSVEGETEFELLNNKFLKLLYPILTKIDINKGMSNSVEKNIVSPSRRKYNVPIIYIIDMDKLIKFQVSERKFVIKKDSILCENHFGYYFTDRRLLFNLKKRIFKMVEKCFFRYNMPVFFSSDFNLKILKSLIKKYCLKMNYFVMDTTVEGLLINRNNIDEFIDFTKYFYNNSKKINNIDLLIKDTYLNEKINIYRLLLNGKNDLLMGIKQLEKENPISIKKDLSKSQKIKRFYESISENNIADKTDGWLSNWIEYFICGELKINPFKEDSYYMVKNALIKDKNAYYNLKNKFKNKFEELDLLMFEINRLYDN